MTPSPLFPVIGQMQTYTMYALAVILVAMLCILLVGSALVSVSAAIGSLFSTGGPHITVPDIPPPPPPKKPADGGGSTDGGGSDTDPDQQGGGEMEP